MASRSNPPLAIRLSLADVQSAVTVNSQASQVTIGLSHPHAPEGFTGCIPTVVETNIHYPTDSSLLGDGARVLTRTMKTIEKTAGKLQRKLRDRAQGEQARDRRSPPRVARKARRANRSARKNIATCWV